MTFPTWCSILELVRTHFAAAGGEEVPPRKFGKAAEPHRSKPQKNPEKNIGSNHFLILGEENFLILMNFDEENFKTNAEQEISHCRPGDWNHALRVVEWTKQLGKDRKDLPLLVSAAYIHDIGWRDVLPKDEKINFDKLLEFEGKANDNSKSFVSEFLKSLEYSSEEIEVVNRLVRAADAHESKEEDEEIIVDADNLSKLTIDHLKEKYKPTEWLRMWNVWREMFPTRVKTEIGKSRLSALLDDLKISIDKNL